MYNFLAFQVIRNLRFAHFGVWVIVTSAERRNVFTVFGLFCLLVCDRLALSLSLSLVHLSEDT